MKCKSKTETSNETQVINAKGRPMLKGTCEVCGTTKNKFLPGNAVGKGILNDLLNVLPLPEMHMPLDDPKKAEHIPNGNFNNTSRYSYCGPYTKVSQRTSEGYKGVNQLDQACLGHDIAYANFKDTSTRNIADKVLANAATNVAATTSDPSEKRDAELVSTIMQTKAAHGAGHVGAGHVGGGFKKKVY